MLYEIYDKYLQSIIKKAKQISDKRQRDTIQLNDIKAAVKIRNNDQTV